MATVEVSVPVHLDVLVELGEQLVLHVELFGPEQVVDHVGRIDEEARTAEIHRDPKERVLEDARIETVNDVEDHRSRSRSRAPSRARESSRCSCCIRRCTREFHVDHDQARVRETTMSDQDGVRRAASGRERCSTAPPPTRTASTRHGLDKVKSGWGDLNSRPSVPQTDALTKLRHSPCEIRTVVGDGGYDTSHPTPWTRRHSR